MNKQDQKQLQNEERRLTKQIEATRAEESAQETAKPFAHNTKQALKAVRKSNTSLFVSIQEAYKALYVPEAKPDSAELLAFNHYKTDVLAVFDRSSFNKCVRICQNDLIMSNLARLPSAWSTLSKIDSILTSDDELQSVFIELLDTNEINVLSAESSVIKSFIAATADDDEVEEEEDAVESIEPVVSFDSSNFSDSELAKLDKALVILESLGFYVEDQSAESEELDDDEESEE
jgi:hypothetical protein